MTDETRVCAQAGPKRPPLGFRFLCTEPDGHEGDGEYDRWPQQEVPEPVDA